MTVVIFSYNRGPFLENCVLSVRRHAQTCPIVIFDDGSDDDITRGVLRQLRSVCKVVVSGSAERRRYGALHQNMQEALESLCPDDKALFLQDDMQIVRPLSEEDFDYINGFFDSFPDSAMLHPCFLKGCNRSRDLATTYRDSRFPVYFREDNELGIGICYSDVAIVDCGRLIEKGWVFADGELANEVQARKHFKGIGFMDIPFAMWLPDVPASRGKTMSLLQTVAQLFLGSEVNNYVDLSDEQVLALRRNSRGLLPFAEDILTTRLRTRRPYSYSSVDRYPFLSKFELLGESMAAVARRVGRATRKGHQSSHDE